MKNFGYNQTIADIVTLQYFLRQMLQHYNQFYKTLFTINQQTTTGIIIC